MSFRFLLRVKNFPRGKQKVRRNKWRKWASRRPSSTLFYTCPLT